MRLSLTAAVVTAGLCMLVVGVAFADVRQPVPESTRYTARRGSYNMPSPQPTTVTECDTRVKAAIAAEGRTRTSGSIVYQCITTKSYIVTFVAPPVVLPPVDCVVSEWGAWSDPAWMACADGMQSRSIVRTRTVLTQPANGGSACPSLVETQPQTRECPGTARLSWTHDGLNTTEYRITHWRDGELPRLHLTPGNVARSEVLSNLPSGTWFFHVAAANCPLNPDLICNLSNPSQTGSKVVQ
jgi:hypothetical protein